MKWVKLTGYSINEHLKEQGLSFDAFDVVDEVLKENAAHKLRKKMANRLVKVLRSDGRESKDPFDLYNIKHGAYCIGLDGEFEFDYTNKPSRILYIGSGNILNRIQSHLENKLFDFAYELRVIPFRFYFCDLTEYPDASTLQRDLEQALLDEFHRKIDPELPLLNAINAKRDSGLGNAPSGWDAPLHRDKGPQATSWLIKAKENNTWKGALL